MLLTWKSGAKLQIRKNITKFIWHFLRSPSMGLRGLSMSFLFFFRQNHVGLCRHVGYVGNFLNSTSGSIATSIRRPISWKSIPLNDWDSCLCWVFLAIYSPPYMMMLGNAPNCPFM